MLTIKRLLKIKSKSSQNKKTTHIPRRCSVFQLQQVAQNWDSDGHQFAQMLRKQKIPHISYSSVSTVEFCQVRYYLEYVKCITVEPEPLYFTKGRILHEIASYVYKTVQSSKSVQKDDIDKIIEEAPDDISQTHILNAVSLLIQNVPQGWDIVAVEQPFVISIDPNIPPCVGIIDLILRRDGEFMVIDHKTGSRFYDPDPFQLFIYKKYIQQEYGARTCRLVFDQYRWVNNLSLIRTPAFRRVQIPEPHYRWQSTKKRIVNAYKTMCMIQNSHNPTPSGECYRCPLRSICNYT